MVSKFFENLVKNSIVDHLEKCGFFSDFQYDFRDSQSTADLLTVLSESKLVTRFDILVFFTNLSLMEFQVRYLIIFCLFLVIDSFQWFWMGNLHKNIT